MFGINTENKLKIVINEQEGRGAVAGIMLEKQFIYF